MAQTVTAIYMHVIFATKGREPSITPAISCELHAYLGGIARNLGVVALAIGGVADHVHCLLSLPPTVPVSDLVGKLKANSSRWVHERGTPHAEFAWQTGYGAFSVSKSNVDNVIEYIRRQKSITERSVFRKSSCCS